MYNVVPNVHSSTCTCSDVYHKLQLRKVKIVILYTLAQFCVFVFSSLEVIHLQNGTL